MCNRFSSTIARAAGLIALALAVPACGADDRTAMPASPMAKATAAGRPADLSRNPCDLVTKQEVEETLGTTVREPKRRSNVCNFAPDGKPMRAVSYAVRWTGGREAMKVSGGLDRMLGSLGDKDVQAELKKAQARAAAELQGLGDEASFQLVTLHVRKGDASLTLDARLCSRLQAIAIARKIVDRL